MSVAAVTDERSRRGPRLTGLVLAATLAAVAVLFGGGIAAAHSYLRSSDPADGSTVQGLPATVSLDFNETIQNFEPVVVVTGPDGKNHATGQIRVVGNVVSTAVSKDGPPGPYAVAYRVVSADGHPVTGELHFTVTAPASSTSAPSSSSPSPTSGRASSSATASSATPSPRSSTAGSSTAGSSTAGSSTAGSSAAGGSIIGSAGTTSADSSSSSAGTTPANTSDPGSSTPVDQSGSSVPETSSGPDWWIWVAIAVAAVILIVAGVITLRRPHED